MANRYDPDVIDQPVAEPISVSEAKLHSRVTGSVEDSLFAIYIGAAREYLQSRTNRTFHQETLGWSMDNWPGYFSMLPGAPPLSMDFLPRHIELPRATPLLDILSVTYTDSDGNATVWPSTEYELDVVSRPGRLVLSYNKSWPSFTPKASNAIRIIYTAGARDTPVEDLEQENSVKYAMLLLVGGMYSNREGEQIPDRNVMDTISLRYGVEAYISKLHVRPEWVDN